MGRENALGLAMSCLPTAAWVTMVVAVVEHQSRLKHTTQQCLQVGNLINDVSRTPQSGALNSAITVLQNTNPAA